MKINKKGHVVQLNASQVEESCLRKLGLPNINTECSIESLKKISFLPSENMTLEAKVENSRLQ